AGEREMYNLTVDELHTFYVVASDAPVLVHNCPNEDVPQSNDTWHSILRGAERDIDANEVMQNAENMYYDENGNQVYVWKQGNGQNQVTIRDPSNGNIVTNQWSSDNWVNAQVENGRWYDIG